MEQSALRAVISLVEVSKLLDLTKLLQHRVVEECMALFYSNTEKHRKANSSRNFLYNLYSCKSRTPLSSTWAYCEEWQLHLQMIDRRNTVPHTSGRTMSKKCHLSPLPVIVLLNESSVWMTHITNNTLLKITSDIWEYIVKYMSLTLTWNWATPSLLHKHSRHCCVVTATKGDFKNCYATISPTLQRVLM